MTVALFISVIVFIAGFLIRYHASRIKPNWIYGYRSTRSIQSKKAWIEANRYCGLLFMVAGAVIAIIAAITNYALRFSNDTVILCTMIGLIGLVLPSIVSTEMRLKRLFHK